MDSLQGVPSAERFDNGDWLPADAIGEIADRLIQTEDRFAHLRDRTLVYFWKKKGGTKDGMAILGMCRAVTGPLKALAPGADFMIAMSADQWELHGIAIASHQAEAIVNHELRHAGIRKGKPVINPHTAVFFVEEIAEYGLFTHMLQAAGTAFQQLALVPVNPLHVTVPAVHGKGFTAA
jgi:hypothetical protein